MGYWRIRFNSRENINYQVLIYNDSNDTVDLTPSDTPFVIQEEGDEDQYVPVHLQSGFINIVTNNIQLVRDIIPSSGGSRKVLCISDDPANQFVWRGYVQPRALEISIFEGKVVVGIPVECELSALKYKKFNPQSAYVYVNEIIRACLPSTDNFSSLYFQGGAVSSDTSDDEAKVWLRKKWESNMYDEESNCLTALEDVCNLFGWTCRQRGNNLYFILFSNFAIAGTLFQRIFCFDATEFMSYWDHLNPDAQWEDVVLSSTDSGGLNNIIQIAPGARFVKIKCSIVKSDYDIDSPKSDMAVAMNQGLLSSEKIQESGTWYYTGVSDVQVGGWKISSYNVEYYCDTHASLDIKSWTPHAYIWESPNPDPQIPIYVNYGWLQLTSDKSYHFSNGYIHIRSNSVESQSPVVSPNNCTIELSIGARSCTYQGLDDDGNQYFQVPYGGANGKIVIKFTNNRNSGQAVDFQDISLDYKAAQGGGVYDTSITEQEYTSIENSGFSETKEIEGNICLKNPKSPVGKNFLLNPNSTFCNGLYYSMSRPETFNPQEKIVYEAGKDMSSTVEMVTMFFFSEKIGLITPLTRIYLSDFDMFVYPVGMEIDFYNGITKLRMVKRNYTPLTN